MCQNNHSAPDSGPALDGEVGIQIGGYARAITLDHPL